MKKLTYLLLIAIFSLSACDSRAQNETTESIELESEYLVISPTEFKAELDKEKNAQLIDVRTAKEFEGGTIYKALNYDYLDGTFQEKMATLDKNQTVYVFCAVGGRSGKASELLLKSGFSKVVDLKGGYNAWSK